MVLIVVRVIWAVINASHRPPSINVAAKPHLILYLLMLFIPASRYCGNMVLVVASRRSAFRCLPVSRATRLNG